MRNILIVIIGFLLTMNAFATRQRPDRFIYERKEYRTNSRECPYPQFYMEDYFKKFPQKRPSSGLMSTALYRGYVATYEIKESQLVLSDIQIRTGHDLDEWQTIIKTIVTDDSDMIIDWFSGIIVLHPFDELIDGKRRTSLSLNKGDVEAILLQIENGKLTRVRKFAVGTYKEFKEKQLAAFKKTKEYEQVVEERLKRGIEPAHVDIAINNFLMYHSRKILVDDIEQDNSEAIHANKPVTFSVRQVENADVEDAVWNIGGTVFLHNGTIITGLLGKAESKPECLLLKDNDKISIVPKGQIKWIGNEYDR